MYVAPEIYQIIRSALLYNFSQLRATEIDFISNESCLVFLCVFINYKKGLGV